ncbi:hypothetical protein [Candidatus Bodocaedibacter vickermanii]|uniref:Lipoprotein n=1 Tax=Candidatus Bodocaedibacter vickermanii TaxID=2741701 RepID=A0A7L9RSZ5_9PROT|nr:hypothetical protein CPBP_00297 [Candidatus Paracaedibacteraceae bacterium 'Lake Konstanz']
MKKKSYVMLLLTTTFLIGCGGKDTGGAPDDGGAGGNNGNLTQQGSAEQTDAMPRFDPVALAAKVTTLEQLEILPEFKKLEAWMKPYWDEINNKTHSDLDTYEKKLKYIDSFREVYYAKELEREAAMQIMINAASGGRFLERPTPDKSWSELSDYVEFRSQLSKKLLEQNSKLGRFDLPTQNKIITELGVYPPVTFEDKVINSSIEGILFNFKGSGVVYRFDLYTQPFGVEAYERDTIANNYVEQRFNKDLNYPTLIASIKRVFDTRVTPDGSRYKIDKISNEGIVAVVKRLAYDGCIRQNFLTTEDRIKLVSSNIPFDKNDFYVEEILFTEKLVVAEMIKSGRFGGLFNYLRDKVKSFPSGDWIAFSAAEFDALVAAVSQSLAADITPSTMGRFARQGVTGIDAAQLQVNGVSAGKVEMALPISINLKGKIDGSKSTAGTSGTIAYKMGSTVLGVVHAYANKGEGFEVDSHQAETSVAVSQSMGNAFIEGQVGYIGTHQVHTADMTGHRYQLSVGFDTEYVSPFVQVAYRDFGTQTDSVGYVGAELNIDRLKADTYSLDTHLTAKTGVNSKAEFTGSLEWSASLNLNSGVSFKTDLTLGTVEGSTVGLNANVSR